MSSPPVEYPGRNGFVAGYVSELRSWKLRCGLPEPARLRPDSGSREPLRLGACMAYGLAAVLDASYPNIGFCDLDRLEAEEEEEGTKESLRPKELAVLGMPKWSSSSELAERLELEPSFDSEGVLLLPFQSL